MSRWIDFEGIDGSGKTSVSTRVAQALRARGLEVVHAREDGRYASAISGRLRELGRSEDFLHAAPETELLLNLAREAQLVAEVVLPALRRGAWVVTDRSTISHVGLARHVRGLGGDEIEAAARLASQGRRPDRVFLIEVDPDVARWRRRIRKIRERRLSDSGRKGLLGDSLMDRSRRGFLEAAAAGNWTVLDNTWRSLEETAGDVLDALDGKPVLPRGADGLSLDPDDLLGSYFDFASRAGDRSLAGLLASGLEDPRAHEIRRRAPEDVAAYAIGGLDGPEAWALRQELKSRSPYYVARGLAGLGEDERAWALRRELEEVVPDQVLHGLAGEGSAEAHALRARHADRHPDEALRSARGLDDRPSWKLRLRFRHGRPSPGLAESLAGLGGPRAAALRRELLPAVPLAVLRGTKGVDHADAWALRRRLAGCAPKAVLASIEGMDGPDAWALRDELRGLAPEETAASMAGLDTEQAWRRREDSAGEAPVGTLKSLRKTDRARGEALLERIVAAHPRRLRVAREAAQFSLRTPCTTSSI